MNGELCGCGQLADKYSSGRPECWKCWDWRKLMGPAADYWVKAIEGLYVQENGTAPDLNDLSTWNDWGMRDSVLRALSTLTALQHAYQQMIDDRRIAHFNALASGPEVA